MRKKQQLAIGPCKSLPNSPSHSAVSAASIPAVHVNQVRPAPRTPPAARLSHPARPCLSIPSVCLPVPTASALLPCGWFESTGSGPLSLHAWPGLAWLCHLCPAVPALPLPAPLAAPHVSPCSSSRRRRRLSICSGQPGLARTQYAPPEKSLEARPLLTCPPRPPGLNLEGQHLTPQGPVAFVPRGVRGGVPELGPAVSLPDYPLDTCPLPGPAAWSVLGP